MQASAASSAVGQHRRRLQLPLPGLVRALRPHHRLGGAAGRLERAGGGPRGIMFAFSPYRSDQRAHLQVLLMQWIPLVLWLWHRLLEEPVVRRAVPFARGLPAARHRRDVPRLPRPLRARDAAAQHLDRRRSSSRARSLRVLVPTLALCAAAAAAIFVPYALAADRWGSSARMADSPTSARRS